MKSLITIIYGKELGKICLCFILGKHCFKGLQNQEGRQKFMKIEGWQRLYGAEMPTITFFVSYNHSQSPTQNVIYDHSQSRDLNPSRI